MSENAWHIHVAGIEDADAICRLTREAYAKWVPVIGREPLPMRVDYDDAVRKYRFDLLHIGEILVAVIETIAKADHMLIENLAVQPAFQGQGYGRILLAHIEQVSASLGYTEMKLYTNALFVENIDLYMRLGYSVERKEPYMGGIIVHMRKTLLS